MRKKELFRKMSHVMTAPQTTLLISGLLVSGTASARLPLGMPDPSMMPLWGAAAVVGVILNLALWFGLNVAFADVQRLSIGPATVLYPDLASANWRVLAITALAAVLLLWTKRSVALTLGICAAAGVALSAV